MKIILKKPRWFTVIATLCLVVATLFTVVSCDKPENENKQYTLHFAGEEIDIEPQLIEYGKHATVPENPERENYDFDGWFIDNSTFANEWDFETDIVTQDTTLYAKWELIKICNVDNPLTDLPWLKAIVDGFEEEAEPIYKHARIYRCNYKGGTGFLLEMCVGCPDDGYTLVNCEGESLCVWEFAGSPCSELNIDFENKKLIWEKIINTANIDFSNIEDLHAQPLPVIKKCLHGKWKVFMVCRWGILGILHPTNTFVNIDTQNNTVEITENKGNPFLTIMNGAMTGTFSCSWKEEEVYSPGVDRRPPCYSTYVMQFDEYEPDDIMQNLWKIEKIGWYFESIKNDTLRAITHFTPISSNFRYYEDYWSLRIE